MNIYEMYVKNNNQVGFWIQKDSWHKNIAKVVEIDNKTSGSLKGRSPYYNNPIVLVDVYDIDTMELAVNWDNPERYMISSPGTYSYEKIDIK